MTLTRYFEVGHRELRTHTPVASRDVLWHSYVQFVDMVSPQSGGDGANLILMWREDFEDQIRAERLQQPTIELPDKHPLRIRAEKAEATLRAREQALREIVEDMKDAMMDGDAPDVDSHRVKYWVDRVGQLLTGPEAEGSGV